MAYNVFPCTEIIRNAQMAKIADFTMQSGLPSSENLRSPCSLGLQKRNLLIFLHICKTCIRIKHITFIFHLQSKNFCCSTFDFLEKEVESKVDNLDATEDGEAGEESHCASDKT